MDKKNLKKIYEAALRTVSQNGPDFYGWVNAPFVEEGSSNFSHTSGWGDDEKTEEISAKESAEIFTKKINGAYGERFVMSMGLIASLIENGYNMRFIQFQAEPGVPFNAEGWTVMVIETMPMFHISPEDLDIEGLGELVELLPDNQAKEVCWKNTNKVGELHALLQGAMTPGLDLVSIAQEKS